MNYQNQVLANAFSKALITNTAAPRYAKMSFVDLVSATVLTKTFQKAIKAADALFGIPADENKAVSRKARVKHAKRTYRKHAKKSNKEVIVSDGSEPSITIVKTGKRGRPKGSKNKPKVTEPAQSQPLVIEDIEVISNEDTPINENL